MVPIHYVQHLRWNFPGAHPPVIKLYESQLHKSLHSEPSHLYCVNMPHMRGLNYITQLSQFINSGTLNTASPAFSTFDIYILMETGTYEVGLQIVLNE